MDPVYENLMRGFSELPPWWQRHGRRKGMSDKSCLQPTRYPSAILCRTSPAPAAKKKMGELMSPNLSLSGAAGPCLTLGRCHDGRSQKGAWTLLGMANSCQEFSSPLHCSGDVHAYEARTQSRRFRHEEV